MVWKFQRDLDGCVSVFPPVSKTNHVFPARGSLELDVTDIHRQVITSKCKILPIGRPGEFEDIFCIFVIGEQPLSRQRLPDLHGVIRSAGCYPCPIR